MSETVTESLPLELIERIERHAVAAWPARVVERTSDGWTLRASSGLGGRRLNHALTPCRTLEPVEIDAGLVESGRFAREQGIGHGIQVSPLELHGGLVSELARRGWDSLPEVFVLGCSVAGVAADRVAETSVAAAVLREPDASWLAALQRCDPEKDIEAFQRTVLPQLKGRAHFCRFGDRAVGVAVAGDGLVGLFSLVVAADARRQGLGTALVRSMLAGVDAETAYLQVESDNSAALALYRGLGFTQLFSYQHWSASR